MYLVFDHIKEYQLDIVVALTETWLSSEDSKNNHIIDKCVAHGYTCQHSPRTSGRRGGGMGILVNNAIKVTFRRIHVNRINGDYSYYLLCIFTSHCNIPHVPSKINRLKNGTFYEEFSEYVKKLSCVSGKVIIPVDFNKNKLGY